MPYTDRLIQMKKDSGKSTQLISDETGVPTSTITRILNGQTEEPTFANIAKIVKAIGGSLDELAGIPLKKEIVVETKTVHADEKLIDLYERCIHSKNKWLTYQCLISLSLTILVIIIALL